MWEYVIAAVALYFILRPGRGDFSDDDHDDSEAKEVYRKQTLMVHQAQCEFKPGKYLIKKNGGDVHAAKHERAMRVAAHVVVLSCGHIVTPRDPATWDPAGKSINIEVEGSFSVHEPAGQLTPQLSAAWADGIALIGSVCRERGSPILDIIAHRQVDSARLGDPGPEIWQDLVLGYAVDVLEARTMPAWHVGTGRPIPVSWDPAGGVGEY